MKVAVCKANCAQYVKGMRIHSIYSAGSSAQWAQERLDEFALVRNPSA